MNSDNKIKYVWIALVPVVIAGIIGFAINMLELTAVSGAAFVLLVIYLFYSYREFLKTRTANYGMSSIVSIVMTLCIVGVLNYLSYRAPQSFDLTRNSLNSLSDQSVKVVQGLKSDVNLKYFAQLPASETDRALFDQYRAISPRVKVEYVDPRRDLIALQKEGITRIPTLVLEIDGKKEQITQPDEEKITNSLIKLVKTETQTFCNLQGHGERDFEDTGRQGYASLKESLEAQQYKLRTVKLYEEGRIPAECQAIAILGPTAPYAPKEVEAIDQYLSAGGKALFAFDAPISKVDSSESLAPVLKKWFLEPEKDLVYDPRFNAFQANFPVPVIPTYNRSHKIGEAMPLESVFPLTRSIKVAKGAPASLNVQWLSKSSNEALSIREFDSEGRPKISPSSKKEARITSAAAEGKLKDSKAKENSRIVLFGTSLFAANSFVGFFGNKDLFLNSVSWLLEDESMISIRKKGDDKVELTLGQKNLIFWASVVIVPALVALGGIGFWTVRRKL